MGFEAQGAADAAVATVHAARAAKNKNVPILGIILNKIRKKSFEIKKQQIEKDQFKQKISHEFKTPLISVQNIIDNLIDMETCSENKNDFLRIKYLSEILVVILLLLSLSLLLAKKTKNCIKI